MIFDATKNNQLDSKSKVKGVHGQNKINPCHSHDEDDTDSGIVDTHNFSPSFQKTKHDSYHLAIPLSSMKG